MAEYMSNFKNYFYRFEKIRIAIWYFFEADYLDETDYAMLTKTFEIKNYTGAVPYTFIVKDGKFVADTVGYLDEETTINFLNENNVIK